MDYCRTIYHVVQPGDSFYRLAQRYKTTVPEIILRNPGINPYNLQVGSRLTICTGLEMDTLQQEETDLNNDMRQAWGKHSLWDAMFRTKLLYALPGMEEVEQRLMETPEDIVAVFGKFYSQPMINQLKQLLTEHVQIGGDYMKALRDGMMEKADQQAALWYQNADKIARMLSDVNHNYDYEELRKMLRRHLNLSTDSMMAEQNQQFEQSIRSMDENAGQLMQLSDALTDGLIKQFYRR